MDVIHACCARMDVHKESVSVCVRRLGAGGKVDSEVRTFGTMTGDLLAMGDWLTERAAHVDPCPPAEYARFYSSRADSGGPPQV